jgi:hypothetical protein
MRLTFFILALIILGCQNHTNTVDLKIKDSLPASKKQIPTTIIIPDNIKEYLKTKLIEWSIPDTSNYVKSWWSFYDRDQIPYYVTTDINDDNLSDYAFILKNSNSIRLVIITSSNDSLTHWIDSNFNVKYSDKVKDLHYGVNIESPSHIDCIVDNTKEYALDLKSNGFVLMDLERKVKLYYWENGTIKVFRLK